MQDKNLLAKRFAPAICSVHYLTILHYELEISMR